MHVRAREHVRVCHLIPGRGNGELRNLHGNIPLHFPCSWWRSEKSIADVVGDLGPARQKAQRHEWLGRMKCGDVAVIQAYQLLAHPRAPISHLLQR